MNNIEVIDRRTISEDDARAIAELLCTVWPKSEKTVQMRTEKMFGQWRDYDRPEAQHPRSFLIREAGRVIAHSAAVPRTIGTTAGHMTILALANVCTHPDARGRKLGGELVYATFELVDNGTFPFSLFQTSHEVRPFYEKIGACVANNEVVNSLAGDPTSHPFWDTVVMRYPAGPGWPEGEIDLRGPGY